MLNAASLIVSGFLRHCEVERLFLFTLCQQMLFKRFVSSWIHVDDRYMIKTKRMGFNFWAIIGRIHQIIQIGNLTDSILWQVE